MAKLRKMLGTAQSPYIISLMRLIETQSKATIAKWCMDYCEENILPIFEKRCPNDNRPRMAITAAREWFDGKKKLTDVKNIILNECRCRTGIRRQSRGASGGESLRTSFCLFSYAYPFFGFSILRIGGDCL